jgi:hypothetical protein
MAKQAFFNPQSAIRNPQSRLRNPQFALLLLCAGLLCGIARADKGLNDGIYRDRTGAQHTWVVQRGHLLVWDDKPYAPAGVVFHSAYLKETSPGALEKDQAELDRLKAAGIADIWIDAGRGLLENKVEQTQAVIDAVESRGFRYGLRVGDRHREPLIGFTPTLPRIKVPASKLQPGARESWDVPAPRSRRLVYMIADTSSDEKVQNSAVVAGEVVVERDVAHIEVQYKRSRLLGSTEGMLYALPEIQVEPEELGSFGDLWAGMEGYFTRLKKHLQALKFGPGLRFILDPFSAGDGTVGQEDMVFPSSDSFRTAFYEWLRRRVGPGTLNINWRLNDRRLSGLEEAARLVPLWPRNDPPEGDGWLIDPVDMVAYRCDPRQSTIWTDLDNFRADSLKRWMNAVSTTLKNEGLNVPMLFTWSAYHPLFINSPSPSGYDGFGAQLYGAAPGIAERSAAYALAQAEEADRNTWLIAARVAGPPDPEGNPTPIEDASQVRAAWTAIREAGFRGLYLDPEQVPNAVAMAKDLAGLLAGDTAAMERNIQACFFPMPLATADRVTRFGNGVWWLPSGKPARLLRFGDSIMGYEIDYPFGPEHVVRKGTVLWSTAGKQEFTTYMDPLAVIELYDSAGQPVKLKGKKDYKRKDFLRIHLSEEPVIATGVTADSLFPLELATRQLEEFDALLKLAEAQKLNSAALRTVYDQVSKGLSAGNAGRVYSSIQPFVTKLRLELAPYIWLEGERSTSHNFTGVAFHAGCSMGTFLNLKRPRLPVSGEYRARYNFEIRRDASYEIWMAGRVPGRPGVSPLVWQLDDEPEVFVGTVESVESDYTANMGWFMLGRVTLQVGRHSLILSVPEKAASPGGRYAAGIDAIVLSREPFKPNGIQKPEIRIPASAPAGASKDAASNVETWSGRRDRPRRARGDSDREKE